MASKKPTHVVCHPSLYLRGEDGKLEEQPVGKKLILSGSQGKQLVKNGFVKSVKDAETQDLSDGGDLKKAEKLLAAAKKLKEEAEKLKASSESEMTAAKKLKEEAEKLAKPADK